MASSTSFETNLIITKSDGSRQQIKRTFNVASIVDIVSRELSIAINTVATVWDPVNTSGLDTPQSFDMLYIVADRTIQIELTANEGDAAEELFAFELPANCPFVLGSDYSTYDHQTNNAIDVSTPPPTADVIDKIRIGVDNTGAAATVRFVLGA